MPAHLSTLLREASAGSECDVTLLNKLITRYAQQLNLQAFLQNCDWCVAVCLGSSALRAHLYWFHGHNRLPHQKGVNWPCATQGNAYQLFSHQLELFHIERGQETVFNYTIVRLNNTSTAEAEAKKVLLTRNVELEAAQKSIEQTDFGRLRRTNVKRLAKMQQQFKQLKAARQKLRNSKQEIADLKFQLKALQSYKTKSRRALVRARDVIEVMKRELPQQRDTETPQESDLPAPVQQAALSPECGPA